MMPGMSHGGKARRSRSIPLVNVPQSVPSRVCLSCEVCCRFPEADSFLRPYFTREEIARAQEKGIEASFFPENGGSQILVVPHPSAEGCLCPAFDPETFFVESMKIAL